MGRFFTGALLWFFLSGLVFAQNGVVLVNDPWPPYVLGDAADGSQATSGIAVELINQIFNRIDGVDAKVLLTPWKRSLHGVAIGSYDGIPMLFKTVDREEYMVFSAPLFEARTVFFYKPARFPEGISWKDYEDLTGYKIAVQGSFSIADTMQKQIDNGVALNVAMMDTDKDCFRLLALDRVDLVATNEIVGQEFVKRLGLERKIIATSKSLYEKPFYIGFSKKTEARKLLPQINRVIHELQDSGVIDEIITAH
ncbi:MAG: transporter substrate-binding domain-containing protein [Motiliproteus sp.]